MVFSILLDIHKKINLSEYLRLRKDMVNDTKFNFQTNFESYFLKLFICQEKNSIHNYYMRLVLS